MHEGALAPIQYKEVRVTTALNSTVNGANVSLPDGVIVLVGVVAPANVPRGRVYGQLQVRNPAGTVIATPWSGYVHTGQAGTAFPGLPVSQGFDCRVVGTQGSGGASATFTAIVGISPAPQPEFPSGVFFFEEPGSGRGEPIVATTADPAAGANPAVVTTPANVVRRVRGASGRLVTAVGSSVQAELIISDSAANTVSRSPSDLVQGATLTVDYGVGMGVAATTAGTIIGIPAVDVQLLENWTVQLRGEGIAAGDDWGPIRFVFEEWAVP